MAGRVRASVALSRRWFAYWRKRYVWLRLLLLVAVFAGPVYETRKPVIQELVAIAIKGIESAKRGPYFEARAVQFEEKKRLQRLLLAAFDRNGDARLDGAESRRLAKQTGLSGKQVAGSALRVELDPLVEACHRVGLLSRTRSANDFRRHALARALESAEREHEQLWSEVEPDLAIQYPSARDYLKWETWKRGLDLARGTIVGHLGTTLGSAFAGLTPSEYASMGMEPRPKWWGAVGWVGLGLVTILCIRRYGRGEELERRFREEPEVAAAPCPVCGVPTQDFGSLPQLRWARAWATAAVAGLAVVTMGALGWPEAARSLLFGAPAYHGEGLLEALARAYSGFPGHAVGDSWMMVTLTAAVFGVVRWVLWPKEIHATHRRPHLRTAGFTAGVVLVVVLLSGCVSVVVQAAQGPRARVLVVRSTRPERPGLTASRRAARHRRREEARSTRGARLRPKPSGLAASQQRRGHMRGAAADRSDGRAASSERRRRHAERMAERMRARRGSRERGRAATRGEVGQSRERPRAPES